MTDRENFEAWLISRNLSDGSALLHVGPKKEMYHHTDIQQRWEAWKAALASQQPEDDVWVEFIGEGLHDDVMGLDIEIIVRCDSGLVDKDCAYYFDRCVSRGNIIAYRVVKP